MNAGRESAQEQIEDGRIALAQVFALAGAVARERRERADVRVRVEPAHAVGERIGCELDIGIEHQVIVRARAVQHEVVRGAVADVRVAVQVRDVHAGVLRSASCRA